MSSVRIELRPFELDRKTYERVMSRETWKRYRIGLWLTGVGVLAVALPLYGIATSGLRKVLVLWYPPLVMWSCVLLYAWRGEALRLARSSLNRFTFEIFQVALAGGCIEVRKSGGAFSILPLTQVVRFSKQPSHYLLYENSQGAYLIHAPRSGRPMMRRSLTARSPMQSGLSPELSHAPKSAGEALMRSG